MWNKIRSILVVALAVLSSVLYRMGGSEHFKRFYRPVGIGLGVTAVLWLLFGFHWSILLSGGISAGLSTTYFGFINPLFGLDKKDKYWFNWCIYGIALSLATIPLHFVFGHWLGLAIRLVVLTATIALWSEFEGNATREELGRGFIIIITLFFLLI